MENNVFSMILELAVDRAAMDKQLRERTSLTASQRKETVDHLFGLEQAVANSSASSSSSNAGLGFLETARRPKVVCGNLCGALL